MLALLRGIDMVEYGKTAVVSYKGTLRDGTVFDSTEGIESFEFIVGSGEVIHGFDEAVSQMDVGECISVRIPAKDAYGDYDLGKIENGPMYAIPNAQNIKVGKLFYFITDEGLRFPAKVLEINEGIATIDYNHPLAGKDLDFEIELIEVR